MNLEIIEKNRLLIIAVIFAAIIGVFSYFNTPVIPEVVEGTVEGCVTIEDAINFVGEEKCVAGYLDHIFISKKGTVFFDFCDDYKSCPFTAVVFASATKNFDDLTKYEGETIKITGQIKTYQGKPEIIINDPEQIQIVD